MPSAPSYSSNSYTSNLTNPFEVTYYPEYPSGYDIPLQSVAYAASSAPKKVTNLEWLRDQVDEICVLAGKL